MLIIQIKEDAEAELDIQSLYIHTYIHEQKVKIKTSKHMFINNEACYFQLSLYNDTFSKTKTKKLFKFSSTSSLFTKIYSSEIRRGYKYSDHNDYFQLATTITIVINKVRLYTATNRWQNNNLLSYFNTSKRLMDNYQITFNNQQLSVNRQQLTNNIYQQPTTNCWLHIAHFKQHSTINFKQQINYLKLLITASHFQQLTITDN